MKDEQFAQLIEAVSYGNYSADWFYGVTTCILILLIVSVWATRS